MIVTDIDWKNKAGEKKQGYYIDKFLMETLTGLPRLLKQDHNLVGILSSHGKIKVGMSTMAAQIGYFISWMVAGGKMCMDKESKDYGKILEKPTKEINFSNNNFVNSEKALKEKAIELPKGSVIIYKVNDNLFNLFSDNLFQKLSSYGHIILIALPNFFDLPTPCATGYSAFLIDVDMDKDYKRGNFKFYNTLQKEKLSEFGRRKLGTNSRYGATHASFIGKFNNFNPLNHL